ncbi:MAG: hypothetical protein KA436_12425 [Oligoflexales bacterium]|nr:hypothetical protein [Oligoflexales bacterium]
MRDIHAYSQSIRQLRSFFQDKMGFVEVPAQSRLSILAACEDPSTISLFEFSENSYPLPQTGQMWLELELLKNPGIPGVFCATTSYRNEANPIPGRHDKIFPMFEFESAGGIDELRKIEADLLSFLGFSAPVTLEYEQACSQYQTSEIKAKHEDMMHRDFGPVISLEKFPRRTHPFWNMKHNEETDLYNKIDVILYGVETIGSAERATSPEEMYKNFHQISNGQYAELLFKAFGQKRVIQELDEYLSLSFFPRFGAGIGITRLARALDLANLLKYKVAA